MKTNDLLIYADSLFKTALYKCKNTDEAEELVQETFSSAINSLNKGKTITDPAAFLNSILYNRYYDMLRRKYKLPTISYDVVDYELFNDFDMADELHKNDETASVRRELAFMAKIYREVMVRYYMKGESIDEIAEALSIPKGTVLSRLDTGRKSVKKGVESMEKFTANSYQPQKLSLGINGRHGLNNEPVSLINSPIEGNILIFAYEKPVSLTEIANGLGIATAYIEPIVEKLVYGELMKKTASGKVYTDFPIFFKADKMRNIDSQIKLVENHFDSVWKHIEEGLRQINSLDFTKSFNKKIAATLESYFVIDTIIESIHNIRQEFLGDKAIEFSDYPDRPNGGKWYASGTCLTADNNCANAEGNKFRVNGKLISTLGKYMGKKFIALHDYDTKLGRTHSVYRNFKYSIDKYDLLKLLFGLYTNNTGGINKRFLELIPELEEIGLVTTKNKKAEVDIPVLSGYEFKQLNQMSGKVIKEIEQTIKADLFELTEKSKIKIPQQINVPEYKKYLLPTSVPGRFVFTAIERGLFHNDINYNCPAIVMVIGKDIE